MFRSAAILTSTMARACASYPGRTQCQVVPIQQSRLHVVTLTAPSLSRYYAPCTSRRSLHARIIAAALPEGPMQGPPHGAPARPSKKVTEQLTAAHDAEPAVKRPFGWYISSLLLAASFALTSLLAGFVGPSFSSLPSASPPMYSAVSYVAASSAGSAARDRSAAGVLLASNSAVYQQEDTGQLQMPVALTQGGSSTAAASSYMRPVFLDRNDSPPPTQTLKMPEPSVGELTAEELANVNLFRANSPCVVNIANIALARDRFTMDVFKIPQGTGSGFIWDDNGHVVTNFHVIKGAREVQVTLVDQSVCKAKLVGADPDKDIAVLKLDCPSDRLKELKPVTLGASSQLFVGQKTFAIGNPFGLDHTLTQGIISGLNRELATGARGTIKDAIQTDAAINPGNSGGVLLDSKGRVIGVNTAIYDPTGKGSNSGVGFAIPIDAVKPLVAQILQYGRVIRPVLGISIAPPQALRQMGVEGVLVMGVDQNGPAGQAGLKPTFRDEYGRVVLGDVIQSINGKPVRTQEDLFSALDECKVGDTVKLELLRDGSRKTASVKLAERPSA